MKTRRKFFSSIAAALSLPFLPKVLAKSVVADSPKDNVYTVPSVNTLIEKAMRVTQTLEPDTEKALARLNRMLERWAGESWQSAFDKNHTIGKWEKIPFVLGNNSTTEVDLESGDVTITELIPIADASQRYPEYMYLYSQEPMKMWPEPPVYPVHFQPWPWENSEWHKLNSEWHKLGDIKREWIVTVNSDGTTKTVPLNQGNQS